MADAALQFAISMDTGNISQAMGQARQTVASGMREMAQVAQTEGRRIQEAMGNITSFREMKLAVEQARGEWAKAQMGVSVLAQAMDAATTPTRKMQREFDNARRVAADAKASFETQREALQRLRGDMVATGIGTNNLANAQQRLRQELAQNAERMRQIQTIGAARQTIGLAPSVNVAQEVLKVKAAYETLRTSGTMTSQELSRAHLAMTERIIALQNGTEGWASRLALAREQMVKLAVAGVGLGMAANQAIKFEAAMADVRKVVSFPTPQAFMEMGEAIKQMSREIPLTVEGLAQIAVQGGNMGIAANEIQGFTELAAKMGVAFRISSEEAGEGIGRLKNIFALSIPDVQLLGDAINYLGNNSNATERNILAVLNRIGGMGRAVGLANQETAALATTFLAMGMQEEKAATAIDALLRELANASNATSTMQESLKILGTTGSDLAANIKKGPQKAIQDLLTTISKLDQQTKMEVLVDMFGKEYSAQIVQVVNNMEKYSTIMDLVSKQSNYAGSMETKYQIQLNATREQLHLLSNATAELGTNLGEVWLPTITKMAHGLTSLAHIMADLAAHYPLLAAASQIALTTMLGWGVAVKLFPLLKMGVIALTEGFIGLEGVMAGVGAASTFLMMNPIIAATAALALMGGTVYLLSSQLEKSSDSLMKDAEAIGKTRKASTDKVNELQALRKTLVETTEGTEEHTAAEKKLAELVPKTNITLDARGRVLAKVNGATSENISLIDKQLDLLKKENEVDLAKQIYLQAQAFDAASKKVEENRKTLENYGVGTEKTITSNQLAVSSFGELTGKVEETKNAGEDLRRKQDETHDALRKTAQMAVDAGKPLSQFASSFDQFGIKPENRKLIIEMFSNLTEGALKAAGIVGVTDEKLKSFTIGMRSATEAAIHANEKALTATNDQLSKVKEKTTELRTELEKAINNESQSWKEMSETLAAKSKMETDAIADEYAKRRMIVESSAKSAQNSERMKMLALTQITIQENNAKLANSQISMQKQLYLTQKEFEEKKKYAKELGLDATHVDEEMLQSKRKILETTYASYHTTIEKLIGEEKRLRDAAKQYDEERKAFKESIEETLQSMVEKGMSPMQEYQSRQLQYAQTEAKAEAALRAGNYEDAKRYAKKAIDLAKSTADGVMDGNLQIVSQDEAKLKAMQEVIKSAGVADAAIEGQGKTTNTAADSVQGGIAKMGDAADKVKDQLEGLFSRLAVDHNLIIKADVAEVELAIKKVKTLDDLIASKNRLINIKAKLEDNDRILNGIPNQAAQGKFDEITAGVKAVKDNSADFSKQFQDFDPQIKKNIDPNDIQGKIDAIASRFKDLRDEMSKENKVNLGTEEAEGKARKLNVILTDLIKLKETLSNGNTGMNSTPEESHALGGMIGFAKGGRLPGYGGGDRIHAVLEAGEFVVRKEAVGQYGMGLLNAINNIWLRPPQLPHYQIGGLVNNLVIPELPRYAAGGPVFAQGGSANIIPLGSIDITYNGQSQQVIGTPDTLHGLSQLLQTAAMGQGQSVRRR